jgi:hypothetical protein
LPTVERLVDLFADPRRRMYRSLQLRAEAVAVSIVKAVHPGDEAKR